MFQVRDTTAHSLQLSHGFCTNTNVTFVIADLDLYCNKVSAAEWRASRGDISQI